MGPPAERRGVLSRDTTIAAEDLQVRIWRSLSSIEIARLVNGAARTVRTIARAGVRSRHPTASPHEIELRLAAILLGSDLARRVYPELDDLTL